MTTHLVQHLIEDGTVNAYSGKALILLRQILNETSYFTTSIWGTHGRI